MDSNVVYYGTYGYIPDAWLLVYMTEQLDPRLYAYSASELPSCSTAILYMVRAPAGDGCSDLCMRGMLFLLSSPVVLHLDVSDAGERKDLSCSLPQHPRRCDRPLL